MTDTATVATLSGTEAAAPTIEESHAALVEQGVLTEDGDGANTDAKAPEAAEKAPTSLEKFRKEDGTLDYEALEKSYLELEKKQSSGDTEAKADDNAEGDDKSDNKLEVAKEPTPEEVDNVTKITEKAGVDLTQISHDFLANGELKAEDYEALEKAGYPREMVDTYAKGLTQETASVAGAAMDAVGGAEAYDAMLDWAIENLSDDQSAAFDKAVNSGDKATVMMAVNGLNAQYQAATSNDTTVEPGEQVGGHSASSGSVYADQSEYMRDMADPRYAESEAFRAQVMQKLGRSNI